MDQVRNVNQWLIVRVVLFLVLCKVLGFEMFDNKRDRMQGVTAPRC